jgi:Acetyltransferase (GNAT) domain
MSKPQNVHDTDPFEGLKFPRYKKFADVIKWHPRIPHDMLPHFLNDYWVVHHNKNTPNITNAVYTLYHNVFRDWTDRKEIMPALRKGETIAVLTEDKSTVISAITFLATQTSVVILFLCTSEYYRMTGMASFLFSLMYQVLRCRERKTKMHVYLKANKAFSAWNYYIKRGFEEMKKELFPLPLQKCFENEVGNSPLNGYLGNSKGLSWLYKQFTVQDFLYKKGDDPTFQRFFSNPNSNRARTFTRKLDVERHSTLRSGSRRRGTKMFDKFSVFEWTFYTGTSILLRQYCFLILVFTLLCNS